LLAVLHSGANTCAASEQQLSYMDKRMMVFGDAKKVIEDMVKAA
jgi:NAD(P) transhydrogenase subunit beta